MDQGIGEDQEESKETAESLPSETSEEASNEATEEATEWDAVYEKWRRGNPLWLMTYGGGPSGGYIIDYSSRPRAVFRWSRRLGQDVVTTPLPDGIRLLYTEFPH